MTSNRTRTAIVWLAAAAWACVLFGQTLARAHRVGGIDLTTYLAASRELWRGGNPYALPLPYPYVYPLFLAFVLFPLTWMPADAALAVWYVVSVVALIWSMREMLRHVFSGLGADSITLLLAVVFLVGYPVIQSNLRNGQVNLIAVALCVAAFRATVTARGHVGAAIAAWAAAMATKVVPAVVAVYYARRGRWTLIAGAVAVALAFCALPIVVLHGAVLAYTRAWARSFVGGSLVGESGAQPLDFSAGGMLLRAFPSLPAAAVRLGAALVVLAFAWWADARRSAPAFVFRPFDGPRVAPSEVEGRQAQDERTVRGEPVEPQAAPLRTSSSDAYAFSLYLAVVPLVSPKSEVHHLAFALPAAGVALAAVWYRLVARWKLAAAWLTFTGLCFVAGSAMKRYTDPLVFLSLCALVVTMAVVLRGGDQRTAA